MKSTFKYFVFNFLILLTSCNRTEWINKKEVVSAQITKNYSVRITHKLTKKQTEDFINHWNEATGGEWMKYYPDYFIELKLKNDSIISFRTSGKYIKAHRDDAFVVSDTTFFKKLWEESE